MKRATSFASARGQALTEFLVLVLAVAPLFLLLPLIAKYQDISHAAQMASRYVAFEAMTRNDSISTWKPESQLADEIRRRFFSNANAPIKTGDVAGDFMADQNLFWRDPHGKALIRDFGSDVKLDFGSAGGSRHQDGFSPSQDGQTFVLHQQLGLQAPGIYSANVSVKLANLPAGLAFYEPFDSINLSVARSTSILLDPWTAKNAQQVESKIAGSPALFPVGQLAALSSTVDAAVETIEAGMVSAPKLGKLDFWRDVVPRDRLKAGN
ncbi:MAG: hypothetical protein JWP36_736 [Paucimonas sp.]|nr:hypothetical protein [Paucimonas sp.]